MEKTIKNSIDLIYFRKYPNMIYRMRKTTRKWSMKYKKSINCKNPKGFSQRQHCKYGRKSKTYKSDKIVKN